MVAAQLRRRGLRRGQRRRRGGRRAGRGRQRAGRGADRRRPRSPPSLAGSRRRAATPPSWPRTRFTARSVRRASSGEALADPPASGDRVLVALSGGVDSAVAALLERERGAEVVAVTLKLWADRHNDGARSCCSPEAVVGARALAHGLGLPHLTLDLEDAFRATVVDGFLRGYAAGRTPNPCVVCNGELRIDAMLALAERVGAVRAGHRPLRAGRRRRRRAAAGRAGRCRQGPDLHALRRCGRRRSPGCASRSPT